MFNFFKQIVSELGQLQQCDFSSLECCPTFESISCFLKAIAMVEVYKIIYDVEKLDREFLLLS